MNRAIEFHDSLIDKVLLADGNAEVVLSPAYVHQSVGSPGVHPGEGHHQTIALRLVTASLVEGSLPYFGRVSGGSLTVSGVPFQLLPLPCAITGSISLSFVLSSGETLKLAANEIHSNELSLSTYVEQFPG